MTGVPMEWPSAPTGVSVIFPFVISDGEDGAFVAWRDYRHPSVSDDDVYLQRITASGQIAAGWPIDGFPVSAAPRAQEIGGLVSDGAGGVFVVWQDHRNGDTTASDIYAQRVLSDGTISPGWMANGMPVSRTPGYQSNPIIEPDGSGGCYVAFDDWTQYGVLQTAFVQHLGANGLPVSGWPADGIQVSLEAGSVVGIVADDSSGAVIVWGQARADSTDVFAIKVTASGEIAAGWPLGGSAVALGCGSRGALPDEAGGLYIICAIVPFGLLETEFEIHRWTFAGMRAPGWPEAGLRAGIAPDQRPGPEVAVDGFGGVLLGWYDSRNRQAGYDVYATRIGTDASFYPGWPQDGVLASDPSQALETNVDITSDDVGGAYLTWEWTPPGGITKSKVQHLSASGEIAPGWPAEGVLLSQQTHQFEPRVVSDGSGGAIVVWDINQIFAQHFSMEGPVPALPSLVMIEPSSRAVMLMWGASDAERLSASVYRRSENSDWIAIGRPFAMTPTQLRFEDRGVTPGGRYAYRLAILDGDEEVFTSETWVTIPGDLRFALDGMRPNPTRGRIQAAITLPDSRPARLEVFDAGGRMVSNRDVGSLGKGSHSITLNERVSPGVYWLRLVNGSETLVARGVVLP